MRSIYGVGYMVGGDQSLCKRTVAHEPTNWCSKWLCEKHNSGHHQESRKDFTCWPETGTDTFLSKTPWIDRPMAEGYSFSVWSS